MTSVEQSDIHILDTFLCPLLRESLCTSGKEDRIVLAPYCKNRSLTLEDPMLKLGIQIDIVLVVPEQIQLNLPLIVRKQVWQVV